MFGKSAALLLVTAAVFAPGYASAESGDSCSRGYTEDCDPERKKRAEEAAAEAKQPRTPPAQQRQESPPTGGNSSCADKTFMGPCLPTDDRPRATPDGGDETARRAERERRDRLANQDGRTPAPTDSTNFIPPDPIIGREDPGSGNDFFQAANFLEREGPGGEQEGPGGELDLGDGRTARRESLGEGMGTVTVVSAPREAILQFAAGMQAFVQENGGTRVSMETGVSNLQGIQRAVLRQSSDETAPNFFDGNVPRPAAEHKPRPFEGYYTDDRPIRL